MKYASHISRRILVGFILAVALLMGIGIESVRSTMAYLESAQIVNQTHQILSTLQTTLADLVSAESEARGYIISGDTRQFAFYRSAIKDVETDLATLRRLIIEPSMLPKVDELERLAQARLDRLQLTVETRRRSGLEAVVELAGAGKKLMDDLRAVTSDIEQAEQQLLNERDRDARRRGFRTLVVVVLGSVLAVLLASVSAVVLRSDLRHRERLEQEVLETREREQRRIGQDLHDGVCQQLTGISLLSRSLHQKLRTRDDPAAAEATQITNLINSSIEQTRRVTRGLHPVPDEPTGLMLALRELVETIDQAGVVRCMFECPVPVPLPDQTVATHVYRIAQEALQNAIRHSGAKLIRIELSSTATEIILRVADDGCGIPEEQERNRPGLGLEIMKYRASAIGAHFSVRAGDGKGTIITCALPWSSLN